MQVKNRGRTMHSNRVFEWSKDSSRVVLYFEGVEKSEIREIIEKINGVLENTLQKSEKQT